MKNTFYLFTFNKSEFDQLCVKPPCSARKVHHQYINILDFYYIAIDLSHIAIIIDLLENPNAEEYRGLKLSKSPFDVAARSRGVLLLNNN